MIKEYNQSQPLASNICVYVYSTHSYTQAQACIHIQISWANAFLTWLKKLYSSKLTTLYQISLAVRCLASLQYVVVSVRLDLFYPNDPFFPFVCAPVIHSFPFLAVSQPWVSSLGTQPSEDQEYLIIIAKWQDILYCLIKKWPPVNTLTSI